jgi:hypothetical protein
MRDSWMKSMIENCGGRSDVKDMGEKMMDFVFWMVYGGGLWGEFEE